MVEAGVCRNGHPWVEENLYTNSRGYNGCKACQKEYFRQRQQGPLKSHFNEVSRQWRKAHPGAMAAYSYSWYHRNGDKARQSARDQQHRRRAKERENGTYKVSPKDLRRLRRQPCAHAHLSDCRGPMEEDHIVPIDRGGHHAIGNLQMLCRRHNRVKSNFLEMEVKARAQEDAAA